MRHETLVVIEQEHAALSAMLRSMNLLLATARHEQRLPDFDVLRAMLFYLDEFPERLHHPKESQLLFPRLRERAPEIAPVLDQLDAEHARGEAAVRELEHALIAYEMMGESRRDDFEQALVRYSDFYLRHMALEEEQVLPLARRVLGDADWIELDAAFAVNRDPLVGHDPGDAYRPLFQRILNAAPAPVGLGSPP